MTIPESINIFDWKGSEFLWFYGVAFLVAAAWSVSRRFRANEKFALPGAQDVCLTDPYEMAFLAGGAPVRCLIRAVPRSYFDSNELRSIDCS